MNDLTEHEACAALRKAFGRGWSVVTCGSNGWRMEACVMRTRSGNCVTCEAIERTLRAAVRACIRAAKRAGIRVQESS